VKSCQNGVSPSSSINPDRTCSFIFVCSVIRMLHSGIASSSVVGWFCAGQLPSCKDVVMLLISFVQKTCFVHLDNVVLHSVLLCILWIWYVRVAVLVFGLCSYFCKLTAVGVGMVWLHLLCLWHQTWLECVVHCDSLYVEMWWRLVEHCVGVWDVGSNLLPVWHLLDELSGGLVQCYCGGGLVIHVCCIGRWFAVGCWEFFITVVISQGFIEGISGDGTLFNFLVKRGGCKVNCNWLLGSYWSEDWVIVVQRNLRCFGINSVQWVALWRKLIGILCKVG